MQPPLLSFARRPATGTRSSWHFRLPFEAAKNEAAPSSGAIEICVSLLALVGLRNLSEEITQLHFLDRVCQAAGASWTRPCRTGASATEAMRPACTRLSCGRLQSSAPSTSRRFVRCPSDDLGLHCNVFTPSTPSSSGISSSAVRATRDRWPACSHRRRPAKSRRRRAAPPGITVHARLLRRSVGLSAPGGRHAAGRPFCRCCASCSYWPPVALRTGPVRRALALRTVTSQDGDFAACALGHRRELPRNATRAFASFEGMALHSRAGALGVTIT